MQGRSQDLELEEGGFVVGYVQLLRPLVLGFFFFSKVSLMHTLGNDKIILFILNRQFVCFGKN